MAIYTVEQCVADKAFIASEVGLVTKTYTGEQTNATAQGNKKYIVGGSVYPSNGTGAKGIVFETVDMTDDEKRTISVITAGHIYENRLAATLDSTAKTELEAIGITFLTAPEAEY